MKKLVFSLVAAVALVSVNSVFANSRMDGATNAEPTCSSAPADTTVQTPAQQTVDTTAPAQQIVDTTAVAK